MKRVKLHLIIGALVGVAMIPMSARAETLLTPWLGANTGGNASASIDFGAGVGTMIAGVIGVDFDFGYSPDFFGNNLNSHVLTTMGNVTVAIPFDVTHAAVIRPYVTGGVGLIHAHIENPYYGSSASNNDAGVNFGGGVIGFLGAHIGVRADLRYLRSLGDDSSSYPYNQVDLSHLHFWRTSLGLVLR
jgi:hypothetical protein